MPVSQSAVTVFEPELHHISLDSVFRGVEHSLSSPDTPIHQYRGIKYASVPARFRRSKVFSSYPPAVDASRYGPICPQIKGMKIFEETLFGLNDDDIPQQILKQNEFECLNLNITCPGGLTPQSHLPVMVWVHGGDDRGSGASWVYDGGAIVRKSICIAKPVIMVTFNFRLGLFGFAAGPQLREDGEEGIGNFGLRDQRNLLEWLHRYIGDFGGDPHNITLFGQSSGAFDIVCHLLSTANETRPLFHRAIVQSAVFDYNIPEVDAAGSQLSRLMSSMHLSTISQLRAMDADQLVKFGRSIRVVDDGIFLRHDWKDYLLPEDAHRTHHLSISKAALAALRSHSSTPRPSMSSSSSSHTSSSSIFQPLLIGDCGSDSTLWSTPISYWSSFAATKRIKAVCQSLSKTNALFRTYDVLSNTSDEEIAERLGELIGDARVAWPTDCFAANVRRAAAAGKETSGPSSSSGAPASVPVGGGGVWRYVFDQEGPWSLTPHHAADLMYLFDNAPVPNSAISSSSSAKSIVGSGDAMDMFPDTFSFSDDEDDDMDTDLHLRGHIHENTEGDGEEEGIKYPSVVRDDDAMSSEEGGNSAWGINLPSVAAWSYSRVRDTMQEQWISFANGQAPFGQDKVYVFGPEGETGERSSLIFEGRRRKAWWKKVFEPLGMQVVQKMGVELSRGPPLRG
ncbi:hypothetical protein D9757_003878 [Collybiopsis confluens]|uniref:Carboxylic ester hydrolase n=1 Tax=Collybiopsis confluens TaxID=2823264 RepID=A0A8H5MDH8_9AGAR|nr:hypothetical protein D9757_003878 [Collybiopsis confluens]